MNGEIYLFMIALLFTFFHATFITEEADNSRSYVDVFSKKIINQQMQLVSYCHSSGKCNKYNYDNAVISNVVFLDKIYSGAYYDDLVSCYNHGYVYTFYTRDNNPDFIKSNININQIAAQLRKDVNQRTFVITPETDFFKNKMPDEICSSSSGTYYMKNGYGLFLVNYVGQ